LKIKIKMAKKEGGDWKEKNMKLGALYGRVILE